MAKRKGPNKAAAIREYLQANPTAKGVDVVKALAAKGMKVAAAQVSNVKVAMNKKSGKKPGRPKGKETHGFGNEVGNGFVGFGDLGMIRLVQAGTRLLDGFNGDLQKAVEFLRQLK